MCLSWLLLSVSLIKPLICFAQSNEELMSDKAKVEDDNRCLEGEIQELRNKLSSLEEALNSPTGDARQSVINR